MRVCLWFVSYLNKSKIYLFLSTFSRCHSLGHLLPLNGSTRLVEHAIRSTTPTHSRKRRTRLQGLGSVVLRIWGSSPYRTVQSMLHPLSVLLFPQRLWRMLQSKWFERMGKLIKINVHLLHYWLYLHGVFVWELFWSLPIHNDEFSVVIFESYGINTTSKSILYRSHLRVMVNDPWTLDRKEKRTIVSVCTMFKRHCFRHNLKLFTTVRNREGISGSFSLTTSSMIVCALDPKSAARYDVFTASEAI